MICMFLAACRLRADICKKARTFPGCRHESAHVRRPKLLLRCAGASTEPREWEVHSLKFAFGMS